jgi:hypothetical protein
MNYEGIFKIERLSHLLVIRFRQLPISSPVLGVDIFFSGAVFYFHSNAVGVPCPGQCPKHKC